MASPFLVRMRQVVEETRLRKQKEKEELWDCLYRFLETTWDTFVPIAQVQLIRRAQEGSRLHHVSEFDCKEGISRFTQEDVDREFHSCVRVFEKQREERLLADGLQVSARTYPGSTKIVLTATFKDPLAEDVKSTKWK